MDTNQSKLYVGNLPYSVTNDSLRDMFASFGDITDSVVIIDRDTRRSKGFGFVTFSDAAAANAAVEAMNGKDIEGRKLVVNVARPMAPRDDRGGFRN